jgi:Leucine-rich repeat (LRR) protein
MKSKLLILLFLASLSTYAQTNLVPNGNFETWTSSSQPDNWFRYFSGFASQSNSAQNGTSSTNMMIDDGTFNFINSQFFPVVANKTYRVTLYHKLVSGSFSAIDLSLYHKPGTFKEELIKKTDATVSNTQWRKIEFDYTPNVSENIEVDIWTTGTLNSEILVDNVSVIDVATIGAQYTLIPDVNFEKKLIALGIDSGAADGKVLTNSVNKLTSLDVSNSAIVDLTGIQDFKALTSLYCNFNQLTNLDVSKNLSLINLSCSSNKLNTLNLSKNSALSKLDCSYNSIINLDISKNTNLTLLDCTSNLLESFDVTLNTTLQYLICGNNGNNGNKFSVLDISKNTNLKELNISNLKLSSLDIRNNIVLEQLYCSANNLSSLDLSMNKALKTLVCDNNKLLLLEVSVNKLLKDLNCSANQLTYLDISNNNALLLLNCSSNRLKTLNLKNGNNANLLVSHGIYFQYFNGNSGLDYYTSFKKNPDLSCILVDNSAYSNTNWADKKETYVFYSPFDCSTITPIPDDKFEDKLIALGIDTDGKNGVVLNSSIASITTLDVSNSTITDLKGIEGFSALTTLYCSGNLFTKIDLSKNASITTLNCSNNPTLACIQVADVAVVANWATTKDAKASFSIDCTIYTQIPDGKFEDKLIALDIDRDGKNGKVATESIASLTYLDVSSSSITDLTGIQDFGALTSLSCTNNQITTLDLSKNIALTYLICYNNQLTNLNISKNTNLNQLDCSSNKLTSLDISINTALIILVCNNNKLTTLNLSKNTKLAYLLTSSNQLASFDVSNNVMLYQVWCSYNKIKTLDFSKNPLLKQVLCNNNKLVTLNIKNGKNTLINTSDNGGVRFNDNPDLKCILVDDAVYANTNWGTKKDATASYNTDCTLYTLIPDSNFEQKLIDLGIDTDGKNGKVLTSNVFLLTSLNVSGSSIADLTGIEDFVSLTELNCNNNVLTTLNVAKTIDLTSLKCSYNQLTTLDISKNIALIDLECSNNNLTSVNVTLNKVLTELNCSSNKLTNVDVSGNKALIHLDCSSNKLSTLDFSGNTALISIGCSTNQLTTLNVSKNTQLQSLSTSQNLLEQLNVINNTKLESILCSNNLLRTLDLSKNVKITTIDCSYNKLKTLNLRNGNNAFGAGMMFVKNFTNNPDLTCIEVDDVTYSDTNWKYYKDITANYNVGCYTLIPDPNFEDKLIALGIDTDGKNGKVETVRIASLPSLDVSSSSIKDLTGIQDFITLTSLDCGSNQLKTLDVYKNVTLTYLGCYGNQLTTLDVSKNTSLTNLACSGNQLTTIDVSKNVALTSFGCAKNQLTTLDISKNIALTAFGCYSNQLTSLDVSKNTALRYLDCSDNRFQTLNLKNGKNTLLIYSNIKLYGNQNLYCILVDDVTYSNKNWGDSKDTWAKFNTECNGLTLPTNNFNVESKGETCLNSNNGEIIITATATFAYKATINTNSYTFTNNSLKVPNLVPGTYTVTITIPGENFEQNFTIVIPKGASINGKSSVAANKVSVEITEGTAPYTVFVDGIEQFETTDSNFTVDAKKGGLLQVKTAKACEGIYAKDIARIDGAISAYPNPTSGSFEIELPSTNKEVVITLYTLDGQMVSTKTYTVENGKAQLTLENHPAGVYVAKIELDTPDYLKIIKN